MFKVFNIYGALGVFFLFFQVSAAYAKEYLLEADIDTRAEYNSNIFLTDQPHDGVNGIIITPSLSGIIKEENWEGEFRARVKSQHYSDTNLDSNDQFYNLTGQHYAERNILSLNIKYDLASNLNSTSTDFGVVGRRVNTKNQSITPQYTRLLTERSALVLSYAYTDVDFLEAENTGYTPYITEAVFGSLRYNLTERDELSFSLSAVDYTSKDDLVTYQMLTSRFGIDHGLSETLTVDFIVGVSRQTTTNLQTESFDFFGQPITVSQVIDSKNRGFVLDAGVTQLFERSKIEGRLSRDNITNSFGGLDRVDRIKLIYDEKISQVWRYFISARFDDITSIGNSSARTDRDILVFDSIIYYSIAKDWEANASYRYIQRKFKSDTSGDRAPHSNRVYLGLTYNFPPLSTF